MQEIEVTYSFTAGLFVARIDDKKLAFDNSKATRMVPEGKQLALQWFVRGAPGARYTIKITKPQEAKFEHQATLDADRKDAGVHWFQVGEEV